MQYGALEAGGTKMVCAIGDENGNILERCSIPTLMPEETISSIIGFFRVKKISALGIASFGPLCLDRSNPKYGYITTTPKPGWMNCDLAGTLGRALNVPVGFDTDVNGSLLGEITYGSSKGLSDVVYITIGTGIGGGVLSNGKLLHGMLHPELGHMLLRKHPDDNFVGRCPFHHNCFEGMASGPAIKDRWGVEGKELSDREDVWRLEAYYIGQAIVNIILTLSPQRIILGGGVMHQLQLMDMIRNEVKTQLGGYLETDELNDLSTYIITASLNDDQGIMGCIKLALMAAEENDQIIGVKICI